MRHARLILLCWIFLSGISQAQEPEHASGAVPDSRVIVMYDTLRDLPELLDPRLNALIENIHHGILSGDVQLFSEHFAHQLYITLRGKEGGYFSSNQALCILQNYFSGRRTLNFRFTTVSTTGSNPYATGGGTFLVKGNPEILQVYVALAGTGDGWVITQFNVY